MYFNFLLQTEKLLRREIIPMGQTAYAGITNKNGKQSCFYVPSRNRFYGQLL